MARYRWAFRLGWVLSHLVVFLCVALFVRLGLWQLSRLHERREANAVISARQDRAPTPIADVLSPNPSPDEVTESIFRPVTMTGSYRQDDQVLVRNRTMNGSPGFWVVTPLALPDGRAVAVNRGWIPLPSGEAGSGDGFKAPEGTVDVTGLVQGTQRQEGLGVTDPPDGRLAVLSRVDIERLQDQVAVHLYPVYVNLATQQPSPPHALPVPVSPPVLDDGPHLNYTGQWFIFATLTVVVYPLLLRRTAARKEAEAASSDPDGDGEASDGDGTAPPSSSPIGASAASR